MRRGDGLYLRGKTWRLDFVHEGTRHHVRLGRNIGRTVAAEIARVKRAGILKAEVGIGGPKRKDPLFDDAVKEFVAWAAGSVRLTSSRSNGTSAPVRRLGRRSPRTGSWPC